MVYGRQILVPVSIAAAASLLSVPASAEPFSVGLFRPWAGYTIPNGVWLTGDFNGDGKSDILHAVANTDYANVWMSNGGGGFAVSSFRPWAGYSIPNGVWLTGDFNSDGKSDVFHAVANTDYANVWTSNGDGTFTVSSFRPWSGYGIPNGLWMTGDFNGDSKTDVLHAVANTDYANIWTSNGNNTFTVTSFRPWAGYSIPNGIWLTGDFNNDRKTDIFHAVANTDYANVWTSNGNATFSVASFRPWPGYAIPNGPWMTGDFNGDGKTDVVHAVANTDYANVWTSNGNATFAVTSFRPWAGYSIPNGVWLTGDFDGDKRTDIIHAVANTDYVHIWHSRSGGTFSVSSFSPWAGYGIPNGLWLTGDFSGDRKTDIVHAVQNTDYVHPWISGIAGPGEVSVDGIEVTQAIQDMAHTVPVLAGKTTWARAYLSAQAAATVRGVLSVRNHTTGVVTLVNSSNSTTLDPTQYLQIGPKRAAMGGGLNFPLPAALTASPAALTFTLTAVTDSGGATRTCADCASSSRTVNVVAASPMRIRVVGLQYNTAGPGGTTIVNAPTAADLALTPSWLRRAYPTGNLLSSQISAASSSAWPFTCNQANTQLAAQRATEIADGTVDGRTHYLGLVSVAGGYMRGCAAGIPGTVASSPAGSPTGGTTPINVAGDPDGSFADWYGGHELGHTFGRMHPGFCNGNSADDANFPYPGGQLSGNDERYTGLDVGDAANGVAPAVLPGTTRFDIMTYCNQQQWPSAYTYEGIRAQQHTENPTDTGPAAGALVARSARETRPALTAGLRSVAVHHELVAALPRSFAETKPALSAPAKPTLGLKEPPASISPPAAAELRVARAAPALANQPVVVTEKRQAVRPELVKPARTGPPPVQRVIERAQAAPAQAAPSAPAPAVKAGAYVSVVVTVNLSKQTAKIVHVNRVKRAAVPRARIDKRAAIIVKDASGRVIGTYPVSVQEDTDVPADEDRTAMIDAIIPYLRQAASLEVKLGTRTVDTRKVSRHAPVVKVPTLVAHELTDRKGLKLQGLRLTWTASHPENAPLTYLVQARIRNGPWETIVVGQREPQLALTPDQLARYREGEIQVIANDGFNSSPPVKLTIPAGRP